VTLTCIIPGPTKELRRIPDGDRWCFGCRARLPHDDVLLGDDEPSYYEPVWVCECSRCHKDRTRFPGTDWA
jgi:hypothetical protein